MLCDVLTLNIKNIKNRKINITYFNKLQNCTKIGLNVY